MGTVRADWSYTAAGDVGTVTRYSGAGGTTLAGTTTNAHDALGRLVGIDHQNSEGGSVGAYAYTFDAGDRLTGETFNGTGKTYAYDKLGQLTNDNGSPLSYDAAGNRTGGGYVVGAGNRTTADGTWAYSYDDAGQLTGKSKSGEAWAYTYDHTGRMTGASKSASPGGTVTDAVTYKLDAWGNRIERGQTGTASSTARYVVDGWDTAKPAALGTEGFEAVMDLDGSNAVTSRRVFGAGFDEAVARQDAGGGVTWYGADAQGTVRQVFDNSGDSVGSRAFTAFGSVTATNGSGLDRYAYTGTVTDPLTGLVGDDARQYDPTLGKWTSDDPIGFDGGDYNVSRAVGNKGTTGRDPSGLQDPLSAIQSGDFNYFVRTDRNKVFLGIVGQADAATRQLIATEARRVEAVAQQGLNYIDIAARAHPPGSPGNARFEHDAGMAKGILATVAGTADVIATQNEGNTSLAATKGGSFGVGYFAESIFVAPAATAEQWMAKSMYNWMTGSSVAIDEPLPAPVESALKRDMKYSHAQQECRRVAASGDPKSAERGATSAPFIDLILMNLATEGMLRGVPYIPRNIVVDDFGSFNVAARQARTFEGSCSPLRGSNVVNAPLKVPQGLTEAQFNEAAGILRAKVGHIEGEVVVQGSRAAGTAKATSDIDFAVRVSQEQFDALIKSRFGTPNPGSAKFRTMQHAIETGKIQAGEAGLRGVRVELEGKLGMEVDLSVIRKGGPFDNPPFVPLPK